VLALGSAAFTAAALSWAVDATWDTLRVLFAVSAAAAAVAAFVMLLPKSLQRTAVSLLILFHFGGILTAVTSVPPPGAPAPWLTAQLWSHVYRPYLQFMYLSNAYHFYSPEPGPATLLWFHIEYTDGSARWIKVPNREEHSKDPLLLEYYRRLPIAQNVSPGASAPPVPPELATRRTVAGELQGIPAPADIAVCLQGVPQFQPLIGNPTRFLESYACFLSQAYAHPDAHVSIRGIKIYRVVHGIVPPWRFAEGMDPRDRTLYFPYFQGEFDSRGNLKNPQDPYLYWLLPILDISKRAELAIVGRRPAETTPATEHQILDCLKRHAGSSPWEEDQ
jgi:hypothetical protein